MKIIHTAIQKLFYSAGINQKIKFYIANKCCSSELSIHQIILKEVSLFPQKKKKKILSSKTVKCLLSRE